MPRPSRSWRRPRSPPTAARPCARSSRSALRSSPRPGDRAAPAAGSVAQRIMSTEPRHILLYGTLRAGQQASFEHRLGDALRPTGNTFVRGQLYHLGEYPGVILGGSRSVLVECHEIIDRSVLSALDRYEEYDPEDPRPFDPQTGRGSMFIRR